MTDKKQTVRERLVKLINSRLDCPNCDNSGALMPDGDKCEFCHEEENSRFNLPQAILGLVPELVEVDEGKCRAVIELSIMASLKVPNGTDISVGINMIADGIITAKPIRVCGENKEGK